MALPLYFRRNSPRYVLSKGYYGEEKYLLALTGIEPLFLGPPAHNLIAIPTEKSWVLSSGIARLNKTKPIFCYSLLMTISPVHSSSYTLVSAPNSSVHKTTNQSLLYWLYHPIIIIFAVNL
jgi:hypothetical protein